MAKARTPAKTPAATGLNLALLASVAAATAANSFVYVAAADAAPFLTFTPPLFTQNAQFVQEGTGNIATRVTPEGATYAAANPAPAPAAEDTTKAPAAKSTFAFGVVEVPGVKRGGHVGVSTYPFDVLETADKCVPGSGLFNSFFIPATAERSDPAKKLASTVSSATRRFAVSVGDDPSTGKPVQETVTLPARKAKGTPGTDDYIEAKPERTVTRDKTKPTRKFVIRAEADGKAWGQPGVAGAAVYRTA